MSLQAYEASRKLAVDDHPFYALIMAAMRKADTLNADRLRRAFPEVWDELQARYDAPGGRLEGDAPVCDVCHDRPPEGVRCGECGSWGS